MTLEALTVVMGLAWVGLLVVLWRVAARIEHMDRLTESLEGRMRSSRGAGRG